MRFAFIFALLALLPRITQADGAVVAAQGLTGPWRVIVFVPEIPVQSGPVDFGILVQDAHTFAPVLDATVSLRAGSAVLSATRDRAVNAALYSTSATLGPGNHTLSVFIERGAIHGAISADLDVSEEAASSAGYMLCFAVAPLGIGFFFLNLFLRGRQTGPIASRLPPSLRSGRFSKQARVAAVRFSAAGQVATDWS